ncbi:peptide deformylase [candidate division WOR-3 bacterium JGI_Cruoil_03_51_56]|uniref:Peptide deformylase n=1 Tax=candidate division WOR-3 bacterium JGI_Cruoil_03_51_56 TaxID=1973747 RepID=A0A235BQT3_UNCW3|nr:MAG: peptide deformylase [candidate division WOR-3 bacterium JGI_Cruoil_03_51_56]
MDDSGHNRRVVLYGNKVLRQQAEQVTEITDDIRRLLADLKVTMTTQDGLGLAANQIARLVSAFAVDPRGADVDTRSYCIINPRIVATEGKTEQEEGCLSLPGVYDIVPRPELVRVRGLDENGKPVEIEATGLLARAIMHENDHLHGVLFIDYLGNARRKLLEGRLKSIEAREAISCR